MSTCWAGPAPAAPIFIERGRDSFPLLPFAQISSAISRLFSSQEGAKQRVPTGARPAEGTRATEDQRPSRLAGVQNLICMDSTPTPTPAFSNQSINPSGRRPCQISTESRDEPSLISHGSVCQQLISFNSAFLPRIRPPVPAQSFCPCPLPTLFGAIQNSRWAGWSPS